MLPADADDAIDEDLQSRQMAVYGRESMQKLRLANVLISGDCKLKVWGESTPFTVGSVLYLLGAWGSLWMWKSQVPAFLFQYLGACRRRTPRAPVPHLEGT